MPLVYIFLPNPESSLLKSSVVLILIKIYLCYFIKSNSNCFIYLSLWVVPFNHFLIISTFVFNHSSRVSKFDFRTKRGRTQISASFVLSINKESVFVDNKYLLTLYKLTSVFKVYPSSGSSLLD